MKQAKPFCCMHRLVDRSRMSGDVHVRFCENLRGRFPRVTRLIITGKSKTILEKYVIPAVKQFLAERGLQLSDEKTKITYIKHGFTFLGQTFRKHGNTLHIMPSKEGVLALMRNVRMLVRKYKSAPMPTLVKKLNELLRGWANYHRHVVASAAFKRVDNYVYDQMWRMLRKRHRNKSSNWLYRKYWMASGKKWVLTVLHKAYGKTRMYQVIKVSHIGIKRHRKIKADANPYMPEYGRYFWLRRHVKDAKLLPALSARQMRLALY